jgi:protoporphyrinogen/coproporphyrinogen III oxidase
MFHEAANGGRIAVVGSGISGIAAAFQLANAGFAVDLIEREDKLGGRFGLAQLAERPVMMGGKNIGRRYSAFREFTSALGQHPYEEFGINSSRVKDGELLAVDSSRRAKSLRNVLKMGSPRDLTRLLALAARVRTAEANRFLGSPLFTDLAERSDGRPLSAHFGAAITRNLLRPITVRMNGAEPDEVYLGTFGTNLALALDTFDQLVHGIQPVLDAVAQRVTVRLGTQVEGLVVKDGRAVGVRVAGNGANTSTSGYDGVVVAVPAHAAAEILSSDLPDLGRRLREVMYFPTMVALVEYDRPVFSSTVRALAMDDGPCSNAGAYGREHRHIVRYTFSGRQARNARPSGDQIEEWLGEGEERLRRHIPTSRGATRVASVSRHWSNGYCGYVPFHGRFLSAVRTAVSALPGLALAGDYLLGASLEACFRSGKQAAAKLAEEMSAGEAR